MRKLIYAIGSVAYSIVKEFGGLNHNIKTYVVYGILYDVMFNLYKPFSAKFAERLGGTELHITLLTALPGFFAVIALIPGSIFLTKFKDKKRITAIFFGIARIFLLVMAITPFFSPKYKALIFVIAFSVMNFPDSISQASLQSFLGDLFMPRQRADAIAVRSKFGNAATATVLTISCLFLNFVTKDNAQKLVVYQAFFVLAFLFGVSEIIAFLRLTPRKKNVGAAPFKLKESVRKIIGDKKFIKFCLLSFMFHFAYFMGFPLSNIKLIKTLGANELWVGISAIAGVVTIVASSTFWGRRLVRYGTGKVLAVSMIGLGFNAVLMAVAPSPQIFAFLQLFGGWVTCGINLGVLNGLLSATPDEDRVVYVGIYQTFVNFTLLIAPFVGLLITVRTSVYTALLITAALRMLCGARLWGAELGAQNTEIVNRS